MIPTVDLARFEAGEMGDDELQELAAACEDHGFFLMSGYGCEALVDQTFQVAQQFFAASPAQKTTVLRDEINPLGYYDRELTKQRRDLKEVFDFKAGGYISSKVEKQTR